MRTKLNLYVLILLSTLILSSCQYKIRSTNALLVNINSDGCVNTNGMLNYENDTIRVAYIFWEENGIIGMLIQNKLKVPLYIDWRKCSYVVGTSKNDYWNETVTTVTTGDASTTVSGSKSTFTDTKWKESTLLETIAKSFSSSAARSSSETFINSITTTTKFERITFIPPGAIIEDFRFSIPKESILNIDDNCYSLKDTTILMRGYYKDTGLNSVVFVDTPSTEKIGLREILYTKDSSPISFRSFLTYSTDEKFSTELYINNFFYVSRILKAPANIFSQAMLASPNSFYFFEDTKTK